MLKNSILLSLSLIWICSLVCRSQQIPEDSLWEADIRKFEYLDSTETYSEDAILFVGSSSIRLWTTLTQDMAPYPVIQRGYGGAKLSDLIVYAERIIYPHPGRAIVLFIANDISGTDMDKDPIDVVYLADLLIQIIRKEIKNIPVFYIATTPTPLRWKVWPQIKSANEMIGFVCENYENVYFINTAFAFLDDNNLPRSEFFRDDRLHLNDRGYQIWTEVIKKELVKVLGKNND